MHPAGRQAGWVEEGGERRSVLDIHTSVVLARPSMWHKPATVIRMYTFWGQGIVFNGTNNKRPLEGLVLYACFAITNLQLHGTE